MSDKIKETIQNFLLTEAPPPGEKFYQEHASNWAEILKKNIPASSSEAELFNGTALAILAEISLLFERRLHYQSMIRRFQDRYLNATSKWEKEKIILRFAERIGASKAQLQGDQDAFDRYFDFDTVVFRTEVRIGECERDIHFLLNRFGLVYSKLIKENLSPISLKEETNGYNPEEILLNCLLFDGDERIRIEALRTIRVIAGHLEQGAILEVIPEAIYSYSIRAVQDSRQNVWLQCEASDFLSRANQEVFFRIFKNRFEDDPKREPDTVFFRNMAVRHLCQRGNDEQIMEVLDRLFSDPSPFVRQGLVDGYPSCSPAIREKIRHQFFKKDHATEVAVYFFKILKTQSIEDPNEWVESAGLLKEESRETVQRAWLEYSAQLNEVVDFTDAQIDSLVEILNNWIGKEPRPIVLHEILRFKIGLEVLSDSKAREVIIRLRDRIQHITKGSYLICNAEESEILNSSLRGPALAYLSSRDFTLHLQRSGNKTKLLRGDDFSFRFWRFLYELRNSSTDKRQAFDHTIGRNFPLKEYAPSGILGELSKTKVPGEPYRIGSDQSWRPALPLLDEVISAARIWNASVVKRYTLHGIVEIHPPKGSLERLKARLLLAWKFSEIAELRNWEEGAGYEASAYLSTLSKFGFEFKITPYTAEESSTQTNRHLFRFFPKTKIAGFVAVLMSLGQKEAKADIPTHLLDQIQEYFVSAYGNTLGHLAIFGIVLMTLFLGRHLWLSYLVRKARSKISLVVGGWGTRGKSGTERLKAAIFEFTGHRVLSKSSGCEAMFMIAPPFLKTKEMFLYRPYDKATIWEHHTLLQYSAKSKTEIFLWECMGLTPSYVQVLQNHWSRDDYSTITNTYPDHEDLQGPAGKDIPEVMKEFIPHGGRLFTTEEEMLPILREGTTASKTELNPVSWLDAAMLPGDLLKRFPYEEHPLNIALVNALAKELGIPREVALKEMADRVVPDLGVLKTYPRTTVKGRTLEFINGMSANERFGAMTNWQRMNFADQSPESDPRILLTTVVNNRADRVPRSRVFAAMIAEDLSADQHVLIGSNLNGLYGYIQEAWEARLNQELAEQVNSPADFNESFERLIEFLRIPKSEETIRSQIEAIGEGLNLSPDQKDKLAAIRPNEQFDTSALAEIIVDVNSITHFIQTKAVALTSYTQLSEKLKSKETVDPKLLDEIRTFLTKIFLSKLNVVEDFGATGDEVIQQLIEPLPPGLFSRIMGIQNIKGTGLDFIYTWQTWDEVEKACLLIDTLDPPLVERGLAALRRIGKFGILCDKRVSQCIENLRSKSANIYDNYASQVALIQNQVKKDLSLIEESKSDQKTESKWWEPLVNATEAFLDTGDAVRRRKKANSIYKDLQNERITPELAAEELKALIKRQKGGWLLKMLTR